jgi:hypothetical protein
MLYDLKMTTSVVCQFGGWVDDLASWWVDELVSAVRESPRNHLQAQASMPQKGLQQRQAALQSS